MVSVSLDVARKVRVAVPFLVEVLLPDTVRSSESVAVTVRVCSGAGDGVPTLDRVSVVSCDVERVTDASDHVSDHVGRVKCVRVTGCVTVTSTEDTVRHCLEGVGEKVSDTTRVDDCVRVRLLTAYVAVGGGDTERLAVRVHVTEEVPVAKRCVALNVALLVSVQEPVSVRSRVAAVRERDGVSDMDRRAAVRVGDADRVTSREMFSVAVRVPVASALSVRTEKDCDKESSSDGAKDAVRLTWRNDLDSRDIVTVAASLPEADREARAADSLRVPSHDSVWVDEFWGTVVVWPLECVALGEGSSVAERVRNTESDAPDRDSETVRDNETFDTDSVASSEAVRDMVGDSVWLLEATSSVSLWVCRSLTERVLEVDPRLVADPVRDFVTSAELEGEGVVVLVWLALNDSEGGNTCVTDDVFVSLGSRLHDGLTSPLRVRRCVSDGAGDAVGVWTSESVLGRMALALGWMESDGVREGEAVGDGVGGGVTVGVMVLVNGSDSVPVCVQDALGVMVAVSWFVTVGVRAGSTVRASESESVREASAVKENDSVGVFVSVSVSSNEPRVKDSVPVLVSVAADVGVFVWLTVVVVEPERVRGGVSPESVGDTVCPVRDLKTVRDGEGGSDSVLLPLPCDDCDAVKELVGEPVEGSSTVSDTAVTVRPAVSDGESVPAVAAAVTVSESLRLRCTCVAVPVPDGEMETLASLVGDWRVRLRLSESNVLVRFLGPVSVSIEIVTETVCDRVGGLLLCVPATERVCVPDTLPDALADLEHAGGVLLPVALLEVVAREPLDDRCTDRDVDRDTLNDPLLADERVGESDGVPPDIVTVASVLAVCVVLGEKEAGDTDT